MLRNKNVHGLPGWSVDVRCAGGRVLAAGSPTHDGPAGAHPPVRCARRLPVCPQYYYTGVSVCEQRLQVIQVYSESVCSSLFYCITLGRPSCAVREDTRWLTFKDRLPAGSPPCVCVGRSQPRGTTKTPSAADAFSPQTPICLLLLSALSARSPLPGAGGTSFFCMMCVRPLALVAAAQTYYTLFTFCYVAFGLNVRVHTKSVAELYTQFAGVSCVRMASATIDCAYVPAALNVAGPV